MSEEGKTETITKAEKPSVSTAPVDDTDFEVTADMMVHEFDDETTLNEEDDEDIETNAAELEDLAKESEMPLEELYALYYGGSNPYNKDDNDPTSDNLEQSDSNDDLNSDGATRRNLRSMSALASGEVSDSSEEETTTLRLDDHKQPRVGDDYQVSEIPETIQGVEDSYNAVDEQVWVPWKLPENVVAEYLKEIAIHVSSLTRNDADSATFIQDNEDALFLLRQCDNDIEEALRRYKSRPPPVVSGINVWSEEECQQFENGLAIYGKDFYLIHVNQLRSKSVRDIVKFYYLWKKSERYDQFTAKTRLGKKKELLPANVTDYMDRLLDETDSACSSAFLNYNGGNHMKYNAMAHNVALLEHLRQLEAAHTDEHDVTSMSATVNTGVTGPIGLLASAISPTQLQTHINNNSEISISESDINEVLNDLTQSSSGFG